MLRSGLATDNAAADEVTQGKIIHRETTHGEE